MLETNTAPAGDNVPSVLVSIEDMQAQLAVAEEQAETLRRDIAELRQLEKSAVIDEIKTQIADYEITADDLFGKKPTRKAGDATDKAPRAIYRDTITEQEYRGGKMPAWLKTRLETTGLEYPEYRDRFMVRVN